ncbi:MAG: thiol oxidoreductase [Myxococcales bacterium]|nr:thiol oxidoreductase [Myxococcales bacterium]
MGLALSAGACRGAPAIVVDPNAGLLGGEGTIFDDGAEALLYPARNLSQEHRGPFQLGDGIFNRNWTPAPATPQGNDGLGPTYNAISCSACHDHRGAPPTPERPRFVGLLLRLSVPGADATGAPLPEPRYGDQLQPYGILKVPGEGTPVVTYTEVSGTYADGEPYSLRSPSYAIEKPAFGPLDPRALVSPRLAPQTVGLGLLQAVDEATILAFAAKNGGRPNRVWDIRRQAPALGRFGWKASQPTLEQQVASAFHNDIGITSALYPAENCPAPQGACAGAPRSRTQPELEGLRERAIVVHTYGLAVPVRRRLDDALALRGERLFSSAGCTRCHVPAMTTGDLPGWPELSRQTIRPFTDLLLHEMGEGLADGRPDFLASGTEWRTPPLWGLGLVEATDGALFLLHDGRARGFAEAILWHGGQAEAAREAFRAMSKTDREGLVAFLSSL